MNIREFHNGLRILTSIDGDQVARVLRPVCDDAEDLDNQVSLFMRNPHVWFVRAPDAYADAVWEIVQERLAKRAAA